MDSSPKSEQSIESVLADRRSTHGKFSQHAQVTRELMMTLEATFAWRDLTYEYQEAIHMIMHKIARIVSGKPYHPDHVADIIGYAMLMQESITDTTRKPYDPIRGTEEKHTGLKTNQWK